MITCHRTSYCPWYPHAKIVRTRGEINQTALVVFWLWWVIDVDLSRTRKARLKALSKRETEAAYRAGIESQTSVKQGAFGFNEPQITPRHSAAG
jgi:hypothetical protein